MQLQSNIFRNSSIYFQNCNGTKIEDNVFDIANEENRLGIYLQNCENSTVKNNVISVIVEYSIAIYVQTSYNTLIQNNVVTGNIYLQDSINIAVTNNTLNNSDILYDYNNPYHVDNIGPTEITGNCVWNGCINIDFGQSNSNVSFSITNNVLQGVPNMMLHGSAISISVYDQPTQLSSNYIYVSDDNPPSGLNAIEITVENETAIINGNIVGGLYWGSYVLCSSVPVNVQNNNFFGKAEFQPSTGSTCVNNSNTFQPDNSIPPPPFCAQ